MENPCVSLKPASKSWNLPHSSDGRVIVLWFDGWRGVEPNSKIANEEVNASGRRDCLKVLSALVAAVRHPAAASAVLLAAMPRFSLASVA